MFVTLYIHTYIDKKFNESTIVCSRSAHSQLGHNFLPHSTATPCSQPPCTFIVFLPNLYYPASSNRTSSCSTHYKPPSRLTTKVPLTSDGHVASLLTRRSDVDEESGVGLEHQPGRLERVARHTLNRLCTTILVRSAKEQRCSGCYMVHME